MQRRLDPKMGVNKLFEHVSCQGRIQNFFQGGGTNFRHFFLRSFSAGLILTQQVYFASNHVKYTRMQKSKATK